MEGSAQGQPGGANFTPSLPVLADVEELWIGLNDLKLQMNFEWSDGTPVRFTYWHPFEPNNFRDSLEDCVTIWGPVRTWRGWEVVLHLCRDHCSILIAEEGIPQGVSAAGFSLAHLSHWDGRNLFHHRWGFGVGK